MLPAKQVQQITDEALVKIITAKMVVSGRGQYFDGIAVDVQDADIKCAASQVKHHDFAGLTFVKTIGKGS